MTAQRDDLQGCNAQASPDAAEGGSGSQSTSALQDALAESQQLVARLQADLAAQRGIAAALEARVSAAEAEQKSSDLKDRLEHAMHTPDVAALESKLAAAEAQAARSDELQEQLATALCRAAGLEELQQQLQLARAQAAQVPSLKEQAAGLKEAQDKLLLAEAQLQTAEKRAIDAAAVEGGAAEVSKLKAELRDQGLKMQSMACDAAHALSLQKKETANKATEIIDLEVQLFPCLQYLVYPHPVGLVCARGSLPVAGCPDAYQGRIGDAAG